MRAVASHGSWAVRLTTHDLRLTTHDPRPTAHDRGLSGVTLSTKPRLVTGIAPRRAALTILAQVREGRPFDQALDDAVGRLADPDRRLAHQLSAGVLRHQRTLDDAIARFVPRGWDSVAPALQQILRLGAYQLAMLDRVPAHAAVSTAVQLARETVNQRAGGFVNAVLRKVATAPPLVADEGQDAAALAARYSHPEWLVARWLERFGPVETAQLLAWNNRTPSLVLQPARQGVADLLASWERAGIAVAPAPWGAGLVTDRRRPDELPGFVEGHFFVQDPAQALLAWYADLPADAVVADLCAAPGGKAMALGRQVRRVIAIEKHVRRAERLADNLRRAGSGREFPVVADALAAPIGPVDAVLLDAPCLGTGSLARHPDARWRVTPDALTQLAAGQAALLDAAAGLVRRGGLLVYATCSLEPEENEAQVDGFLRRHPEFRLAPPADFPAALLTTDGTMLVLPQRHGMDGAFAARFCREG